MCLMSGRTTMREAIQENSSDYFGRLVFGSVLLLAGAAIALVAGGGWHAGMLAAQAFSGRLPEVFWESLTTLGDERMLLALMLPFCLRLPRVFWAVLVSALLATLLAQSLKWALPMPRPAAVLAADQLVVIGPHRTQRSFPSGHVGLVVSFAFVWLEYLGWRRALPIVGLAMLAAFSRVAIGARWPIDVLGGALVGVLAAWGGLALARRFPWGLRRGVHWSLIGIAVLAVATLPFDGQGYPGSLAFRLALCGFGLAGFGREVWRSWFDTGRRGSASDSS